MTARRGLLACALAAMLAIGGSARAEVTAVRPYDAPRLDRESRKVPDAPPKEIANKSPRNRLLSLPPVPRDCLDDDLTLLDVFAPFVSVPVRLTYCLLYVGTIARLPREIDVRVTAPSLNGPTINVPLLAPDHTQRPLATGALIVLIVVVAVVIGYAVGGRRGQRSTE